MSIAWTRTFRLALAGLAVLPLLVPSGTAVYVCLQDGGMYLKVAHGSCMGSCGNGDAAASEGCEHECCAAAPDDPAPPSQPRTAQAACGCCVESASFGDDDRTSPQAPVEASPPLVAGRLPARPASDEPSAAFHHGDAPERPPELRRSLPLLI